MEKGKAIGYSSNTDEQSKKSTRESSIEKARQLLPDEIFRVSRQSYSRQSYSITQIITYILPENKRDAIFELNNIV